MEKRNDWLWHTYFLLGLQVMNTLGVERLSLLPSYHHDSFALSLFTEQKNISSSGNESSWKAMLLDLPLNPSNFSCITSGWGCSVIFVTDPRIVLCPVTSRALRASLQPSLKPHETLGRSFTVFGLKKAEMQESTCSLNYITTCLGNNLSCEEVSKQQLEISCLSCRSLEARVKKPTKQKIPDDERKKNWPK